MGPIEIACLIDALLLAVLFVSLILDLDDEPINILQMTLITLIVIVGIVGFITQAKSKPETLRIKSNQYSKELYAPKDTIEFEGYKYVKLK